MVDAIIGVITIICAIVILVSKATAITKVVLCGIVFVVGQIISHFFNTDGSGGISI